uniref:L1 transposable element RRM domain-containing protein n=1 Tax=Latimeria chalumnae TaxID=7897 RepID=H2ZX48_LATCH
SPKVDPALKKVGDHCSRSNKFRGSAVPSPPRGENSISNEMETSFAEVMIAPGDIKSEVSNINCKLDKLTNRMDATENWISDCDDRLCQVENLTAEIHYLREKCNDLENRSHRSNLRIVGIPEGLEERDPEAFVGSLIPKVLGANTFPQRLEIERAHQALRPRLGPRECPCIMLVKFLRFQDKVAVMRKARELGALTWENHKIFFFPDLSSDLQAKRKEFTEARRLCHSLKLSFSLLYPMKL